MHATARRWWQASVLVLLFAASAAAANKPCIAANMEDLSTVWVGETVGEYFRLQINPDGTGLLTVQWAIGKGAKAYAVTETTLADRRVGFRLEPLDERAESLYLRGSACRGLLDLQVGSNSPKWKLDVTFQAQARLMDRLQAVTRRAEEYAAQRPR